MEKFEYNANPARVVFGSSMIKNLPTEIQRLKHSAPLLIISARQKPLADDVISILKAANINVTGSFTGAKMHTPIEVTEDAMTFLKDKSADCIVSIGGGSIIGLGKALSVRTGLPHLCIPTTYAGSEMTPVLGETKEGRKTTRSDPKILPATVIYDVDLTMSIPPALTAVSGINAIAHAVESLYASNTNPIIQMQAKEAISSLATSLPIVYNDPGNKDARTKAFYGAWLCSMTLGTTSMALHHKLCHTLGGSFNLPHAETHSAVLAHALSYNAPAIQDQMAVIAHVIPDSNGDAIHGLNVLLDKLEIKRALKDFGMKEEDIDKATDIAMAAQYPNPRKLEREKIREVIRRCWAGEMARADL